MRKSLNKFFILIILIINLPYLFTQSNNKPINGDFASSLCNVTILDLIKKHDIGELVDVLYPSELMPCFIFIFKNDKELIEVMANSENRNYIKLNEMDLNNYVCLGFSCLKNLNGEILQDFFFKGDEKKFSYLNSKNKYTTIVELEKEINLPLIKIDKGGFLFPFYNYIFKDDNHVLEIICTPNSDKQKSYFTGGWTYH